MAVPGYRDFGAVRLGRLLVSVHFLLAACAASVAPPVGTPPVEAAHAETDRAKGSPAEVLRSRVGPPADEVIEAYLESGASYARPHSLTHEEWQLVGRAKSELPELHRSVLERHLVRLSFVDAPESAGTALTRVASPEGADPLFEITLRADALGQSLTEFLNRKEATVFHPDDSGLRVRIDAGDMPALNYLLLHEATHVIDRSRGLTSQPGGALGGGVWADYRRLEPTLDTNPVSKTTFRRAPRAPLADAPAIYAALAQSPFVSLYSTASYREDLAELVAWRELSMRRDVRLQIVVEDAQSKSILRLEPLKSPQVLARFQALSRFLEGPAP